MRVMLHATCGKQYKLGILFLSWILPVMYLWIILSMSLVAGVFWDKIMDNGCLIKIILHYYFSDVLHHVMLYHCYVAMNYGASSLEQ